MLTDILDRGSGHIQSLPVLHLRVTSQALGSLNLPRTQAIAVVERLGAHMDWSKRDGFRAINPAALGSSCDCKCVATARNWMPRCPTRYTNERALACH